MSPCTWKEKEMELNIGQVLYNLIAALLPGNISGIDRTLQINVKTIDLVLGEFGLEGMLTLEIVENDNKLVKVVIRYEEGEYTLGIRTKEMHTIRKFRDILVIPWNTITDEIEEAIK
jgi:hypothetical protein